jgi:hypothetical protein
MPDKENAMRRFIISTLAMIAVLVFVFIFEGGNPLYFLLPSPLLIVVLVPCFSVLAVWSFKDWGRAWKDAFASGAESSEASARVWAFYEKASYIAGVVGFILGLNVIFMDQSLNLDEAHFLKSLSVACIVPILAIIFAMVARILKARVELNRN